MPEPRIAPYGTWRSPITTELITGAAIGIGDVAVDDGDIYWLESRPAEAGRTVLVRRQPAGAVGDLTPAPFNVRSRVHEYGGGAYAVANGRVCFCNFADQRVYLIEPGGTPRPITPAAALRYADLVFDPARDRLFAVREDHRGAGEPTNTVVAIDLIGDGDDDGGTILAEGADFYAAPRPSPDGDRLAWLAWNHPNMPWDGTDLWLADLAADGRPGPARQIAGGAADSIFQPTWSPDGALHFVSDRTGWWNLYRLDDDGIEALFPMQAEFGLPLWQFAMTSYRFLGDGAIACAVIERGISRLCRLAGGGLETLETPFTDPGVPHVLGDKLVLIAASVAEPSRLVILDPADGSVEVLKHAASFTLDPGYVSVARPITFSTPGPTEGGRQAHGFHYPPTNRDFAAPAGELPPLMVRSHGGPTGAAGNALSLAIQFWTSRGFAVVDVNYGGSTGFGRAYRERLDGAWGVVDVDDCVAAARYLVDQGLADPDRLCIRGGSAGGYTTLSALTFRDVFQAGASHYGIGDLAALAADTHKFESRYLDRMIGPLPAAEAVYRARSPIHFTDRLNCPVIFFQGLDDRVVPPNQAEAMVAALRAKGLAVAHVTFEGEGHGFRRAENIQRALDGELYFYGRVFGFEPAGPIEPVAIDNLETRRSPRSAG